MSFLLDTNICIPILKGSDNSLVKKIESYSLEEFFLCSLVKAELCYGARKSSNVEANLNALKKFFEQFLSLPFDDLSAETYGTIRNILEREGKPIGANDLCIASIALAFNCTLITRNHTEFQRVPGLKVEMW